MQGPLVWITGTYYRRTQADPSSLSRGKWEPAMVMGGWGSGGLWSRGVNRSLWAGSHPAWLVPICSEGVSLRSFQKLYIEKQGKKTLSSTEPFSDTKKYHCFKYFLRSVASLPSCQAFDNLQSNTKTCLFYHIDHKNQLATQQAFEFYCPIPQWKGVKHRGKEANRKGRITAKRKNLSSSSWGWQQMWLFGQIISSTRKTFPLKQG